MKTILSILLLACASVCSDAQEDGGKQVHLSGRITELNLSDSSEKPVNGITVEVWAEGEIIQSMTSANSGKYQFVLPLHRIYQIRYSGYSFVGKMVELDATEFLDETKAHAFDLNIDIALFRNDNYMGLDFLVNVPVAKAAYKRKPRTVVWDESYTTSINNRVRSVLKAYGK